MRRKDQRAFHLGKHFATSLAVPYSIPGAFIAQIAPMNRALARGKMVIASANAISGHTVMLTKSGHRK